MSNPDVFDDGLSVGAKQAGSAATPAQIHRMGVSLLVTIVVLIYLLIACWPVVHLGEPGATTAKHFKDFNLMGIVFHWADDRQMLFMVVLCGALGGTLHTLTSFGDYVGNQQLESNWIWFLILRIPVGMLLGLLFYFAIRGGVLAVTLQNDTSNKQAVTTADLSPYGMAAFAAIAGLFSKQATDKLSAVFDVLFAVGDDKRAGALGASQPIAVTPGALTQNLRVDLTVKGKGFAKETGATVNGNKRDFQYLPESNGTSGKIILQDADVATPGALKIVITNPNKDTFETTVTVQDPAAGGAIGAVPAINSSDPKELPAGQSVASINIVGDNFQPGCKVTINGAARDATLDKTLDNKTLTVQLKPEDTQQTGTRLSFVVTNQGSVGKASAPYDVQVK